MKLPPSFYNPLSLTGSIIAIICFTIIIFSLAAMAIFGIGGSYIGLFIYIVLPGFLIIGLILIPVGMRRRARKIIRSKGDKTRALVIDFNNTRQRNALFIFVFGTFILLFFTGIGSYEAFHYTESNEFCGMLCHKVMEPEYTAYQESSHSRVACVDCHVGEGADWYVRSKLSGLYQVYSVLARKYPQPIPTPIENLRPARETCERCHWPNKFYSYRLRSEKHYLADSLNSEWNILLKMKTGSEHSAGGLTEGIHWHIHSDVKVEYVARDHAREFIPWVRYINTSSGDTIIYDDVFEGIDQAGIDTLELRTMDCLDCHNRPSHHYLPPQEFTDHLIASGDIPSDLPGIKSLAMEVLNIPYVSRDSAAISIRDKLDNFYMNNYLHHTGDRKEMVEKAYAGIMKGFSKNIFPAMKTSWDAFPNQVGHVEFNGCFRCHNGNHQSEDGRVISRDCNLCHTIVEQGLKGSDESVDVSSSLEFKHPVNIDEAWKELTCSDCHRYLY